MIWPCSGLFGLYGFENGKRGHHVNFYCQLILKSQKNYENLDFSTSGLCLAFKKFFGLFFNFSDLQTSWIFKTIQIWIILKPFCHWNKFCLKIGKPDQCDWCCQVSKILSMGLTVKLDFEKNIFIFIWTQISLTWGKLKKF